MIRSCVEVPRRRRRPSTTRLPKGAASLALRLDFPAGLDHDGTVASSKPTHGTRAAPPALTRQPPCEPVPPACPRNRDTVIDRITPLLLTLAAGLALVPFAAAVDEPAKKPTSNHDFKVQDIDE